MDHIRRGLPPDNKDDHNQLDMDFDQDSQIVSVRSVMTIQGIPQYDTGLIKAAHRR
jgi:hypothetical protein